MDRLHPSSQGLRQNNNDVCKCPVEGRAGLSEQASFPTLVYRGGITITRKKEKTRNTHRSPVHPVSRPVFPCSLNIGSALLIRQIFPNLGNLLHSVRPVGIFSFQAGIVDIRVENHSNSSLIPQRLICLPLLEVNGLCIWLRRGRSTLAWLLLPLLL